MAWLAHSCLSDQKNRCATALSCQRGYQETIAGQGRPADAVRRLSTPGTSSRLGSRRWKRSLILGDGGQVAQHGSTPAEIFHLFGGTPTDAVELILGSESLPKFCF
jgi:hypothetical protein